jgi:AraC-like DNA-binding protein
VCQAADLDMPNPSADPAMAVHARTLLASQASQDSPSIVQEVRRAIYLTLPTGRATCEWVAQSLGCSMRTLQRELDHEGTSFSALTAEVRRELVLRYIENPRYSLGHVAELLGYSTHSAFTRWFAQQFGASPATWRQQLDQKTRRKGLVRASRRAAP